MNKNYLELFEDIAVTYGVDKNDPKYVELAKFLDIQSQVPSRPPFTEAGLNILEYLQTCGKTNLKAKDVADGMNIASRKVSGAMRKLCADGYVEKTGQNPVIYNLTEQGNLINVEDYRATIVKE